MGYDNSVFHLITQLTVSAIGFQSKVECTQLVQKELEVIYIEGDFDLFAERLKLLHEHRNASIDAAIELHKILEDYILENTNSIKINVVEMQNFYDNMLNDLLKNNDGIQTSEG